MELNISDSEEEMELEAREGTFGSQMENPEAYHMSINMSTHTCPSTCPHTHMSIWTSIRMSIQMSIRTQDVIGLYDAAEIGGMGDQALILQHPHTHAQMDAYMHAELIDHHSHMGHNYMGHSYMHAELTDQTDGPPHQLTNVLPAIRPHTRMPA